MARIPAVIDWIDTIDMGTWDEFSASERADPWDDFGWFTIDVGMEGEKGSTSFQVLVSTPAAIQRAKGGRGRFKGIVVPVFEPEVIRATLEEHVRGLRGNYLDEIVDQLRETMHWEYEGLAT